MIIFCISIFCFFPFRTEDSLSLVDCLQIVFSLCIRSYLFLLYPREILIIDTEILQAVGSIYLERGFAPFLQIVPCAQRDLLYCLHENGCITVRIRQPMELPPKKVLTPADFREPIEIHYNLHCQSEPFRISKSCHPFALAVCPTTELQTAILTSEGRVTFWHSVFQKIGVYGETEDESQLALISALPTNGNGSIGNMGNDEGGITLSQSVAPHWFVPPEGKSRGVVLYSDNALCPQVLGCTLCCQCSCCWLMCTFRWLNLLPLLGCLLLSRQRTGCTTMPLLVWAILLVAYRCLTWQLDNFIRNSWFIPALFGK